MSSLSHLTTPISHFFEGRVSNTSLFNRREFGRRGERYFAHTCWLQHLCTHSPRRRVLVVDLVFAPPRKLYDSYRYQHVLCASRQRCPSDGLPSRCAPLASTGIDKSGTNLKVWVSRAGWGQVGGRVGSRLGNRLHEMGARGRVRTRVRLACRRL